jgi:hypothetical protein
MSKNASAISLLTANRLGDGIVVFLDFEGDWSERIDQAAVARSPDEARALEARGHHDAARNIVVEPYLIEVREAGSGFVPLRTRERVRVAGPSVLGDVPGYVAPAAPSRQAERENEDSGRSATIDRSRAQPQVQPRLEPAEARAAHAAHAQAA